MLNAICARRCASFVQCRFKICVVPPYVSHFSSGIRNME